MNATHYQTRAARTVPDGAPVLTEQQTRLLMVAMGLSGETGELVDHLKKAIFHGHELDRAKLTEEAGDVAWYLAALCTVAGLNLSAVLCVNIAKLERRYPAGFSAADSRARVDVGEGA